MRIFDAHHAALDALDPVALVAELKDIASEALDREIFIHGPDEMVLGFEQHLIVGIVRDGAAGGERRQPRATPAAQQPIDAVMMDERTAPAAPGAKTVGQHLNDRRKILPRQVSIRPCPTHQRVKLVLAVFTCGDLGDDLLRQHVERLLRDGETVELAAAHAVEEGGALDQFVARERKQPALRRAVDGMAGAANALQKARDRAGRAELADEVDVADIDAEFERGGGDQGLELAVLEPLLGIEPLLLGEAAVMRRHVLLSEQVGEWRVTRSAIRRVLTKMSVVRCSPTRSARRR